MIYHLIIGHLRELGSGNVVVVMRRVEYLINNIVSLINDVNVPIEKEESKLKNNLQSYNSNFVQYEIKLMCRKILLSKCNHIIHRWNKKSEINVCES